MFVYNQTKRNMEFKLIVCLNHNNSIGSRANNNLIFNIPQELKHFKKITMDSRENMINVLVMGKHTWDSIPKKPLPQRMNFIISSNYETINYEYRDHHNVIAFPNHETCLSYIDDNKNIFDTTFIIGGISVYEYYLNHNIITQIICTKITTENNDGDIFFNPNYFSFFKLNHYETFNNIESYNNITNTPMMLNYSVCNYLKISKINPNLIYNKSLYLSFTDSEDGSIDTERDNMDNTDNETETENENESTSLSENDSNSNSKINMLDYSGNLKKKEKKDSNNVNNFDDLERFELDSFSGDADADADTDPEAFNLKNDFYISDSENENSFENEKRKEINYSYSMSSLESMQINDDNNDNNENMNKTFKTNNNEIDESNNEWTFINDDDFIVKRYKRHHKMEHKMEYLKYYYSMHNKDNNKDPNMCINPLNIYNDKSDSEIQTYYF